jgi:hypothetical protein
LNNSKRRASRKRQTLFVRRRHFEAKNRYQR